MEKNIILAGVGGQGILSIAYVIDNAALDAGLEFKQAEVHGMAQRGGGVQSHLRYADHPIHSDLVPTGRVDLLLSVEPLEVMRYWHTLSPSGVVIASVTPYVNIPDYPPIEDVIAELASLDRVVLVDSARIARAAGNLRAQNMVVLGAATPELDFSPDQLRTHIRSLFAAKGDRITEVNLRAFDLGTAANRFFCGLTGAGMPADAAVRLCRKLDPKSLDPDHAPAWATAFAADGARLEAALEGEDTVPSDRIAALV